MKYQHELNPYINKNDLARQILGHNNFDTAIPQGYLDSLAKDDNEYCLLRFGLVTNYEDGQNYGKITCITKDALDLLNKEA